MTEDRSKLHNQFITDKDQHYHMRLTQENILDIEQWSKNFWEMSGRKMKVPPRLLATFKAAGGSDKYIEADASLEQ